MDYTLIAGVAAGLAAMLPLCLFLYRQHKTEQAAISALQQKINDQVAENAKLKAEASGLLEKLAAQKNEIEELHLRLGGEFKQIADQILDEKTEHITRRNFEKMADLLNPLKEKISLFEKKVEEAYNSETREKEGLRKELEQIIKTNMQMSEDARRLTTALKGDSKAQGDWGEMQLELILQKAGLEEGVHYSKQESYRDDDGNLMRPDFVINLPENKNFIVDSKVSLTAYERYCSATDENERQKALDSHLHSLARHISMLGQKNYQKLYGINSPDFVFLFVAVEPALSLALQNDKNLFDRALSSNVVLVSATTLLATMRTVSFIWRQENQKNNVIAIANESGKLYDKFVGFSEDLNRIGKAIDTSLAAYHAAMNKLSDSTRYGDTIMGRIENLKRLGANASK